MQWVRECFSSLFKFINIIYCARFSPCFLAIGSSGAKAWQDPGRLLTPGTPSFATSLLEMSVEFCSLCVSCFGVHLFGLCLENVHVCFMTGMASCRSTFILVRVPPQYSLSKKSEFFTSLVLFKISKVIFIHV